MNIDARLNHFLKLNHTEQLDSWQELFNVGNDFLNTNCSDLELAKKLASAIKFHRSLMGSSKAYESATDIDIKLCQIATRIARIGFGTTEDLLDFLKSELYYARYYPELFDKNELEREIALIFDSNKS